MVIKLRIFGEYSSYLMDRYVVIEKNDVDISEKKRKV